MTEKKELLFKEHEDCKLFGFLGIRHGIVMVDDVKIGMIWTRADLNTAVGLAAANHGIDIVEAGVKFVRNFGERLAPNMGAIANQIRNKKLADDYTGGYTYKDGHFYNVFGAVSSEITCLSDAISTVAGLVERGLPVEAGTKLLQDAIVADIPIERPARSTTGISILEILFGNLTTKNDE